MEYSGTFGLDLYATKWVTKVFDGINKSEVKKDQEPIGVGVTILPIIRREVYYEDGELNGPAVDYKRNEYKIVQRVEGELKSNNRNGYSRIFDWTGAIFKEGNFIDNEYQG